jgi:hypothetical protein
MPESVLKPPPKFIPQSKLLGSYSKLLNKPSYSSFLEIARPICGPASKKKFLKG